MEQQQIQLKQLFQQEFSKMVAVISSLFGMQHIENAEDIVSETFLQAAETWGRAGMPESPEGWLYVVAKRKTLQHLRRHKIYTQKLLPNYTRGRETTTDEEVDFSPQHIRDSQLRMMFAICSPVIVSEAQIGLALRILCGFGIDEIAEAFFTNKETINKRLLRAKVKLRQEKVSIEMPSEGQIPTRLANVLHVLYLLFSEGYYSKTSSSTLRKDLCLEAMRLALMLTEYRKTDVPAANALVALMCFHASRFDARQPGNGLVLYEEQDDALWDQSLITRGVHYLQRAAAGNELSSYHLEAAIAYRHCKKDDTPAKWKEILALYDSLRGINDSPTLALNRIYALYRAAGSEPAFAALGELKLPADHFYHLLLAELHKGADQALALAHLQQALILAATTAEKAGIMKKIEALRQVR